MASTLTALVLTLTASLKSATDPSPLAISLQAPVDGISLLDVKNELLLSYLQNLVFLIILKLRNATNPSSTVNGKSNGASEDNADGAGEDLQEKVVKKLIELRTYLEKGVRPLENKLRYQIDKVLRAADDDTRRIATGETHTEKRASNSVTKIGAGSDDESASDIDGDADLSNAMANVDDLSYRPNPAAFIRPASAHPTKITKSSDGVYKPPRITPTALSTATPKDSRITKVPKASATLSEFIAHELSTAPVAEPSIGSTILDRGRRTKSAAERNREEEKRVYEEGNFVRLPKESRKEKRRLEGGRARDGGWGGEEWRGLGEGAERVVGLTKGRKLGVVERARKRERDGNDLDGGGADARREEKRRKIFEKKHRGERVRPGKKRTV
ncbi:MAG: hypothetical protein MMC33_005025 [Icmadophila ericetorum]|nr:hypothetical protein [Icmadophila ericetorum]